MANIARHSHMKNQSRGSNDWGPLGNWDVCWYQGWKQPWCTSWIINGRRSPRATCAGPWCWITSWALPSQQGSFHSDAKGRCLEILSQVSRGQAQHTRGEKILWIRIIITVKHNTLTTDCRNMLFSESYTTTVISKDIQGSLFILLFSEPVYSIVQKHISRLWYGCGFQLWPCLRTLERSSYRTSPVIWTILWAS